MRSPMSSFFVCTLSFQLTADTLLSVTFLVSISPGLLTGHHFITYVSILPSGLGHFKVTFVESDIDVMFTTGFGSGYYQHRISNWLLKTHIRIEFLHSRMVWLTCNDSKLSTPKLTVFTLIIHNSPGVISSISASVNDTLGNFCHSVSSSAW